MLFVLKKLKLRLKQFFVSFAFISNLAAATHEGSNNQGVKGSLWRWPEQNVGNIIFGQSGCSVITSVTNRGAWSTYKSEDASAYPYSHRWFNANAYDPTEVFWELSRNCLEKAKAKASFKQVMHLDDDSIAMFWKKFLLASSAGGKWGRINDFLNIWFGRQNLLLKFADDNVYASEFTDIKEQSGDYSKLFTVQLKEFIGLDEAFFKKGSLQPFALSLQGTAAVPALTFSLANKLANSLSPYLLFWQNTNAPQAGKGNANLEKTVLPMPLDASAAVKTKGCLSVISFPTAYYSKNTGNASNWGRLKLKKFFNPYALFMESGRYYGNNYFGVCYYPGLVSDSGAELYNTLWAGGGSPNVSIQSLYMSNPDAELRLSVKDPKLEDAPDNFTLPYMFRKAVVDSADGSIWVLGADFKPYSLASPKHNLGTWRTAAIDLAANDRFVAAAYIDAAATGWSQYIVVAPVSDASAMAIKPMSSTTDDFTCLPTAKKFAVSIIQPLNDLFVKKIALVDFMDKDGKPVAGMIGLTSLGKDKTGNKLYLYGGLIDAWQPIDFVDVNGKDLGRIDNFAATALEPYCIVARSALDNHLYLLIDEKLFTWVDTGIIAKSFALSNEGLLACTNGEAIDIYNVNDIAAANMKHSVINNNGSAVTIVGNWADSSQAFLQPKDVVQIQIGDKYLTLNPNYTVTGNVDLITTSQPDPVNSNFTIFIDSKGGALFQAANGKFVAPNKDSTVDPYRLQAWLSYSLSDEEKTGRVAFGASLAPAIFRCQKLGKGANSKAYLLNAFTLGSVRVRNDKFLASDDLTGPYEASPGFELALSKNQLVLSQASQVDLVQQYFTYLPTLQIDSRLDSRDAILIGLAMAIWDKKGWGQASAAWNGKFVSTLFDPAGSFGNLYNLDPGIKKVMDSLYANNFGGTSADLNAIAQGSNPGINASPSGSRLNFSSPNGVAYMDTAGNLLQVIAQMNFSNGDSNKNSTLFIDVKGNVFAGDEGSNILKIQTPKNYAAWLQGVNKDGIKHFSTDYITACSKIIQSYIDKSRASGNGLIEAVVPNLDTIDLAKLLFDASSGKAIFDRLLTMKIDWSVSWRVTVVRKMLDILRARFADASVAENVVFLASLEAWATKWLAATPSAIDESPESAFRSILYAWDGSKQNPSNLNGLKNQINNLVQDAAFLGTTFPYVTTNDLKWGNVTAVSSSSNTGQQLLNSWLQSNGLLLVSRTQKLIANDKIVQTDIDGWSQALSGALTQTALASNQAALLSSNLKKWISLAGNDSLSTSQVNQVFELYKYFVQNINTLITPEISQINAGLAAFKDNVPAIGNATPTLSSLVPVKLLMGWKNLVGAIVALQLPVTPLKNVFNGMPLDIYELEAQIYAAILNLSLVSKADFSYLSTDSSKVGLIQAVAQGMQGQADSRIKNYLELQVLQQLSNANADSPGLWERKTKSNTKWTEYLATLIRQIVDKIASDYSSDAVIQPLVVALQAKFTSVPYFQKISWSDRFADLMTAFEAGVSQSSSQSFVNNLEFLVLTRMDLLLAGNAADQQAWKNFLTKQLPQDAVLGVSSNVVGSKTNLDALGLAQMAQAPLLTQDLVQRFKDLANEPLWYSYYGVVGGAVFAALKNRRSQLSPQNCQDIEAARLKFMAQSSGLSWTGGATTGAFTYLLNKGVVDSFTQFINDRTAEFNATLTNGTWDSNKENQGFWDKLNLDVKRMGLVDYVNLLQRYVEWNPSWSNPQHKYSFVVLLKRLNLSITSLITNLTQAQGLDNVTVKSYSQAAAIINNLINNVNTSNVNDSAETISK